MKMRNVLFCLFLVLAATAQAGKSKKPSTRLYEDDSGSSASGKVKVVREVQEETEVFLETKNGSGGPFVLPQNTKNRAAALKALNASQKPGGSSVTLQLDDQQRILSVEENSSGSSKSETGSMSGEQWGL